MPRFFVKNEQLDNEKINIIGEDVKHIKNVLRKQIGDIIEICNQDDGNSYKCEIIDIEETKIVNKIIENINCFDKNIIVDIYQGLPKSDKMELIIQKSIELGVNEIIPVDMKRCVVKLDSKSEEKKISRWQKIAESAAKQSGRNNIPKVSNIVKIREIADKIDEYDLLLICYENEKENYIKRELQNLKLDKKENLKIAVVIGPEGGLEENDVKELENAGGKVVTLGNRILRTETVALNILSIIMYEFDN